MGLIPVINYDMEVMDRSMQSKDGGYKGATKSGAGFYSVLDIENCDWL